MGKGELSVTGVRGGPSRGGILVELYLPIFQLATSADEWN
jgi:hypothetical protein